ncbi:MAG: 4'-phosphopantetheinyl transferase superfamily protein [Clostridia bacterium]|nr:4'-phosphopantetheinyl transferase superfamily protein [Clostridia bacterium]
MVQLFTSETLFGEDYCQSGQGINTAVRDLTGFDDHAKITDVKPFLITVYASLDALESVQARYGDCLSVYRREKTERLRDAIERQRGMLAEYCLIEALSRMGPLKLPLQIQTERLGKPYLSDSPIAFSLSHAGLYAAATISDCPVGVDIERERTVSESLAKRICTPREWKQIWLPSPTEQTFRNLFSAKESIVKRSGEGLMALSTVDTKDYPVRQMEFLSYVLSVCSDRVERWEVIKL